jgi:hypothetical protein
MSDASEDLFEWANFFAAETGLPTTVWVGTRGRVRAESTDPGDQAAVFAWVDLNRDALIAYWDGQIDTIQLCRQLRTLP